MNKVAVIGPGALGCLFAVRLAQSGIDVSLVDYRKERAALLNSSGVTVTTREGDFCRKIPVTTTFTDTPDLVLVLVKSYTTAKLKLPSHVPVMTLQNGLGNAETLAAAPTNNPVLAGTTSEAVTWLDTGHVRHVAHGKTMFGAWTPCDTEPPLLLLQNAGFDVMVTDNPNKAIWKKAIINAGINPLTALLNVPNGALLKKSESRDLLRLLVLEALGVSEIEGNSFDCGLVEEVEQVCSITHENISSMLQDIRNHKPTEIDAISGEILRRAQNTGLDVPHTHTVYNLVRTLEQS